MRSKPNSRWRYHSKLCVKKKEIVGIFPKNFVATFTPFVSGVPLSGLGEVQPPRSDQDWTLVLEIELYWGELLLGSVRLALQNLALIVQ